ncbi:unnamed protein product [Vicia faba]|uniref:Uncharacterized protein n=1 Tax=Vicia faba TaxID=3906 RepID=A0AAV0YYS5_VICFA|nr:unnamed protein product [Vicia faba]
MRMLETTLSLNDEATSSQVSLDVAYAKIQKLKAKNEKLKCDIFNHESRFEAQVRLLKDLNELRPQLEALLKRMSAWSPERRSWKGSLPRTRRKPIQRRAWHPGQS